MKKMSLYVHIPYCKHKCDYCDFVSVVDTSHMKEYFEALNKEIIAYSKKYSDAKLVTVYFGGGTPSVAPVDYLVETLDNIKDCFKCQSGMEVSIEVNPGTVDYDRFYALREGGFNRLSIGGQSANDKILKEIGRIHTFQDLKQTIKEAKYAGFDNINVDMMVGLPGQTIKDVTRMAKFLTRKEVKHVSAYSLILENGTTLSNRVALGDLTLPDEDTVVKMYDVTRKILEKKGIMRYEVSNFARDGYKCKHNTQYWTLGEYIGVGVSAHSYVDFTRWSNTREIMPYITSLSSGVLPIVDKEKLSKAQRKEEMLMLRLRLTKGLHIQKFNSDFGCNLLVDKKDEIKFLVDNGFVKIENGYLRLGSNAFYVLNSIISRLV